MLDELMTELCVEGDFIQEFVKRYFPNHCAYDYKVIGALIAIRASLPSSHARTAVVNTIRGKAKAPIAKKLEWFGMVEGLPRYTTNRLNQIVEDMMKMLEDVDIMEKEDIVRDEHESDVPIPVFIDYVDDSQHRVNKDQALKLAEIFRLYGEENAPHVEVERKVVSCIDKDEAFKQLLQQGIIKEASIKGKDMLAKLDGVKLSRTFAGSLLFSKSLRKDGTTIISFYVCIYRKTNYLNSENILEGIVIPDFLNSNTQAGHFFNVAIAKGTERKFQTPVLVTEWKNGQLSSWKVVMKAREP